MSVRGDLAKWAVDRLDSEVAAFNRVKLIAATTDFEQLAVNPPSAAVIVSRSANAEVPTPPGEVYAFIYVDIWFASQRFGPESSDEQGLTDDLGIYQITDDIHDAFAGKVPTNCDEPMEFIEGDVIDVGDGLVIATVSYRTARVI